jgi:hypothetical protein
MRTRTVRWLLALVVPLLAGCGSTMTVTQTATVIRSATAAITPSTVAQTATATQPAPYSGVAPNADIGPATDQSVCPESEVTVGPNTSCPFAANVAEVVSPAHQATGHFPADVIAHSPVTGKTYSLTCSILGYGSELVCATAAPATGIVVIPANGPIATAPPPTTSTSTSSPGPSTEGPGA